MKRSGQFSISNPFNGKVLFTSSFGAPINLLDIQATCKIGKTLRINASTSFSTKMTMKVCRQEQDFLQFMQDVVNLPNRSNVMLDLDRFSQIAMSTSSETPGNTAERSESTSMTIQLKGTSQNNQPVDQTFNNLESLRAYLITQQMIKADNTNTAALTK